MLNTLLIVGANGLCVWICYYVGKTQGKLEERKTKPEPFFDNRDCICGHQSCMHQALADRWGPCQEMTDKRDPVYNDPTKCRCQRYVAQEINVTL